MGVFEALVTLLIIPVIGLASVASPGNTATDAPGEVTEYRDNWIVAHNNLDGKHFQELQVGDRIYFEHEAYTVEEVRVFQALDPDDPHTLFADGHNTYTVKDVKELVLCDNCLTLQTCVSRNGNPIWGRLFVIARKD